MIALRRVHPTKYFGFNIGANPFMAWLTVTVWRRELDLTWHRTV